MRTVIVLSSVQDDGDLSAPDFETYFTKATAGRLAYGYQTRLAMEAECRSRLIDIPTGLGKTAAVVLAWLWNRVEKPRPDWPRRLVYCLPMRTLVEQTTDEIGKWLTNLELADEVGVHVLMGGADSGEWDIHPERDGILIGTQDMLLSRALNRGYGLSRARWPMHFGLLNNDCLWILDETQLMGVGVRTSAQLEGLRGKIGTAIGCATWWASATLDSRLLKTPDHPTLPATHSLGDDDSRDEGVSARIHAVKRLTALPLTLSASAAKVADPHLEQLATAVLERHQPGTTTIVILNTVDRAIGLTAAMAKLAKTRELPPRLLVHSRFRGMEREVLTEAIKSPGEKILIATQAIEAGVDISSRTLITELAPWSSLVQRFGRCNRSGEFNEAGGADLFWINLEADDSKVAEGLSLPYSVEQLATARALLRESEAVGASPAALANLTLEEPLPDCHVLRRKDLVDLFDTTPDLAGFDVDVGRYVRDGEDRDVQVFWRTLDTAHPPSDEISPLRDELVRVPIHGFRKFAKDHKTEIWNWSVLDGGWQALRSGRIAPGQIYLVDPVLGGYSVTLGWTGAKSKEVFPMRNIEDQPERGIPRDGQGRDEESQLPRDDWQTLATHTANVVAACEEKLARLAAAEPWAAALRRAAEWHDVGKAHACFQEFLTTGRDVPPDFVGAILAKSPWRPGSRHHRPHFRHELASALAWLQAGDCDDEMTRNLVAYLIATHHGKIRLSLRAMPGEIAPPPIEGNAENSAPLFARGIWQGDQLPDREGAFVDLEEFPSEGVRLDLSAMLLGEQDGRPSWTGRVLTLRDSPALGLFRLAWLETILRAADAEGSKR